ncbi:MAG: neutral zinc metallopeptidase [Thermomicrobiales bacterium]
MTPVADAAQGSNPGSGVEGNTYTSSTFGYSVTWDGTWTVIDESSVDGFDSLGLSNDVSTVYFSAYVSNGEDEPTCLATSADLLSQEAGVSDFRQAESGGEPLAGVAAFGSWAVYDFAYAAQGETVAYSAFLLCRELIPGETMLQGVQIVETASYNDELDSVVALFEAVTLTGDGPAQPEGPGQDDPAPDDPAPEQPSGGSEVENFLLRSAEDIDAYWARIYPSLSGGQPYNPPAEYVMFSTDVTSACGGAAAGAMGAGTGPFYCPADRMIYLDLLFAVDQADQFGAFPVAEAVAHEVGHHVQFELGMQVCDMSPCLDPSEVTSQELEVMADCFAGAWSQDAERRGRLGAFDIEANIVNYVIALGDHSSGAGDPGAHGRGALRVFWFLNGYYNGAAICLEASPATLDMIEPPDEEAEADVVDDEPSADPTEEPRSPDDADAADDETQQDGALAIEEPFAIGGLDVIVTGTDSSRTVAESGTRAEGTYLVVYFSVESAEGGPFPFADFVVVDSAGDTYQYDPVATDDLLRTGLPDGADTELEAGETFYLAVVFDVPRDADGFLFQSADGTVTVELDR